MGEQYPRLEVYDCDVKYVSVVIWADVLIIWATFLINN